MPYSTLYGDKSLTALDGGRNDVLVRAPLVFPDVLLEVARPRGVIQGQEVVLEDEGDPGAALGLEAVLHALAGGRHAQDEFEVVGKNVRAHMETL